MTLQTQRLSATILDARLIKLAQPTNYGCKTFMQSIGLATWISVAAFTASVASLWFARRFWLESNRPIVTTFIEEHATGNTTTAFDLILSNTGNRPAINVRLHAAPALITQLLGDGVTVAMAEEIRRCFSPASEVALLRNGEDLSTAFGSYGLERSSQQINYGAEISVQLTYQDLDRRRYSAHVPLKVFARHGFGG